MDLSIRFWSSYLLYGTNIQFTYCQSPTACYCNNYCWLSIFIEILGKLRFDFINNGRMSIPTWRLIKRMNKKRFWCLLHVFRSMFIRLVPICPYNMNFGSLCLNIMPCIRIVQSKALYKMYVPEFLLLTFIFSIIIWGVDVGMKRTAFKLSFFAAYAIAFPAFPPELPTIVVAPDCFAWRHVWPIPLILNEPDGCRLSNFK